MTDFDAAADQILAAQAARRAMPTVPRVTIQPTKPDTISFYAEVESTVGRMVRQIRAQEESQARALLKAAYDAGFEDASDEAGRCCGCNTSDGEDFEGFLDRLLKTAQEPPK